VGQCPTWWPPCRTQVAPSVQRCKVWLTLTIWLPCSNAAKTRKPLKLAGVPQTTGPISAASRPKFTILWGHLEEILLLNKFFFRLSIDIAQQVVRWCADGNFFLRPSFSASYVQQVSDLHPKVALRPHDVWKYGRHPSYLWPLRLGEEKKKEETTGQKYNGLPYSIRRP